MLDRLNKYYKNKRIFLLMFILVLGLFFDLVPHKTDIPQDPPSKNELRINSWTPSVFGVSVTTSGHFIVSEQQLLEVISQKEFQNINSRYYTPFIIKNNKKG